MIFCVDDPAGRIVDLVCRSANRAMCSYLGLAEQDLVGRSAVEDPGNFEASGLMSLYVQCMESGEPVMLNDLPRFSQVHGEVRHYDLRLNRVGPDLRRYGATSPRVSRPPLGSGRPRKSYRRLIDNAAIGMHHHPGRSFEAVNDASSQLFGYDAETFVQKDGES